MHHFMELVIFCLVVSVRAAEPCSVPAGAVKDVFFAELFLQFFTYERNRLVQDTQCAVSLIQSCLQRFKLPFVFCILMDFVMAALT